MASAVPEVEKINVIDRRNADVDYTFSCSAFFEANLQAIFSSRIQFSAM
jgi:hypothetical protein